MLTSFFDLLQSYTLPQAFLFTLPSHPVTEAPKPMNELHERQSRPLSATNPTRIYIFLSLLPPLILNPSIKQFCCSDEVTINDFQLGLPTFVFVNVLTSAITSNSELAWWLSTIHFVFPLTFIPRHILSNAVFEYDASFVCFSVKPSSPFLTS